MEPSRPHRGFHRRPAPQVRSRSAGLFWSFVLHLCVGRGGGGGGGAPSAMVEAVTRHCMLTGILLASEIFHRKEIYTWPGTQMEPDWIDQVVERWSALQPGLPVDAYHVTGRIARIATRIAQREDEVFGRYGLTRGDVGVLSALRTSPPPHTLSPTHLFRGLMMSS